MFLHLFPDAECYKALRRVLYYYTDKFIFGCRTDKSGRAGNVVADDDLFAVDRRQRHGDKRFEALAFVELFFDPPHSSERWVDDELDPCARYSFFDPMTETQRGTPRDQSAWVLEEFPDRPNAVRWTYRITEGEYEEAVRQTLERWADRDEEEKECV